jgi:hypothetical protein
MHDGTGNISGDIDVDTRSIAQNSFVVDIFS